MGLRITRLVGLLSLTFVGGLIAVIYSGAVDHGTISALSKRLGFNQIINTRDYFLQPVDHSFGNWFKALITNTDVVFYAIVGLIGIVMMVLSLGKATSTPAPSVKPDSVVELLKREKENAERLAKVKSEFLNQVSHELRTPLAVIIGYIECLTDGLYGQIEAKHQEILSVVEAQSMHLKNMIDQILIFSRLEAGKQPVRIQDASIQSILNELHDTFEFLCRQKGIALVWELSPNPIAIRTDPDRVRQILSNLLQNAVKYTDRGSITVRLAELTASDAILVEVIDTGLGIPEQYLSAIFDPFIQVHKTSTENSRGGIGLGLSIVKKNIEEIHGSVTVESVLGKGSAFKVVLPRVYKEARTNRKQFLSRIRLALFNTRKSRLLFTALRARKDQPTRALH